MGSGRDDAGGPGCPVLAGGADGPGGVGWEVGDRDCLDATRERISKQGELQDTTDTWQTSGQD